MSSVEANSITTIMEQYSQMIQSFDSRLNSLDTRLTTLENSTTNCDNRLNSLDTRLTTIETSIQNCEFLIREQQLTHSQLTKRIESLENNNNNNNTSHNEANKPALLQIATIEETQYEENHNDSKNNNNNEQDDDFELEEMHLTLSNSTPPLNPNINHNNIPNININKSMPILEAGTQKEKQKENLSIQPTLIESNNTLNRNLTVLECFGLNDSNTNNNSTNTNNNIDFEVLFSAFDATITMAHQSMKIQDFETALAHLKDGFIHLNKYINCNININNIPLNKKHIVAVAYCNQAICYGKLRQYNNALMAINKCIEIKPNWYKSYSTMGALYAYQNMDNKAINAYKKAIQLCDNNNTLINIDQKNKLQKRLNLIIDRNNGNGNRKRKNSSGGLLDESPAKRVKYNNNNNVSIEKRIKQIKERLYQKNVSELKIMCDINNQKKGGGKGDLVERICDGVINGAIPGCPKCRNKFLEHNKQNGFYMCKGYFDVSTKKRIQCDFYEKDVTRTPWKTVRQ